MAKKSATPVDVRVDDLHLSLLGFDITDAQARLVHDFDEYDKLYNYELHWSIRGRFDAAEWRDRFRGRWASDMAVCLQIPTLGPAAIVYWLPSLDREEKIIRVSDRRKLFSLKKPLKVADVTATLTAFDEANVSYDPVPIYTGARKLPIEVVAPASKCGCIPRVHEMHSSTGHDADDKDDRFVQLLLTGTVELCDLAKARAEFSQGMGYQSDHSYRYAEEHQLPRLGVELLDDSGFLLEEDDSAINLEAQVDRLDGPPMRQPRWIFSTRYPVDRYSAEPAKVIARFRVEEA